MHTLLSGLARPSAPSRGRHLLAATLGVLALAVSLTLVSPAPASAAGPGRASKTRIADKGAVGLKVAWAKASKATKYRVVVAKDKRFKTGRKVKTASKNARRVWVKGLTNGATYYYAVRAYRGSKRGPLSRVKRTATIASTPKSLTGLRVTGTTENSISVAMNRSQYATSYRLYAARDKAVLAYPGKNLSKAYASAFYSNPASMTVRNLPTAARGDTWYYTVRASNHGRKFKQAAYSNPGPSIGTTLRPGPVSGFTVTETSPTGATLSIKGARNISQYEIQAVPTNGSATRTQLAYATPLGSSMQATINNLSAGTAYTFRVRGRNDDPRGADRVGSWTGASPAAEPTKQVGVRLNATSYNVLSDRAERPWSVTREDAVVSMLKSTNSDVIGLQEAKSYARGSTKYYPSERIPQKLSAATGRSYLGTNPGLAVSILWDSAKFTGGRTRDVDTGSFEADRDGSAPDAAWQVLSTKSTGVRFLVVNSHLRSDATDAKRKQQMTNIATDAAAVVRSQGLGSAPIVYLGDFNSWEGRDADGPGTTLKALGHLDADDHAAAYANRQYNSTNSFKAPSPYNKHLDRVFVPKTVGVSEWRMFLPPSGYFPSDHNPVRATLTLPNP